MKKWLDDVHTVVRGEWNILLPYAKREKRAIALSYGLSLLQTASLVLIAPLIQRAFDQAIPQGNLSYLSLLLSAVAGLYLLNSLFTLLNRSVTLKITKRVIYELRKELVSRFMRIDRRTYNKSDLDAIHAHIVNDTERVDWMTNSVLTQLIPNLFLVAAFSSILAYLNLILFLVILTLMPLLYMIGRIFGRRLREHTVAFRDDFTEFSKGVQFLAKYNELIALSTAEARESARQERLLRELQHSSERMAFLSTAYNTLQGSALMLIGIVVLFVGGWQIVHGHMTPGALITFYVALGLMTSQVRALFGSIPTIIQGVESLAALSPLLALTSSRIHGTRPYTGFSKEITFDHVDFKHDERFGLSDLTFSIKKGDMVGIYGRSGSGKTTLLNLLFGFYTPERGHIRIDGINLSEFDLTQYRKSIGVLPQNPLIFPGTIRENITYGLSSVDEEALARVSALCRIDEVIKSLEGSYDAAIGNHGSHLSGGQRQRIAMARALLRNPSLLILDEPDNNLDDTMTLDILRDMKQLGITILVVSHNGALREVIDRSLIIEDGGIREHVWR